MKFNYDFDGAIFDMDGTLLDTMPYWRFTSLEYMLMHNWPVRDEDLLNMRLTSSRRLLPEIAKREGYAIDDRQTMISELEGFMNRHYLYDARLKEPTVPAFLERLKSAGVRMCVATGSPREYARNGLRRLGLLDYFEFVTDNYEAPFTKDKAGYFDNVARRLGVKTDRCWVFEDALYSMKSAKADGFRICAIEDASQVREREEIMALADMYIKSYAELL